MNAAEQAQVLEVLGVPGSPYTRKITALLRFRRIPFVLHWGNHDSPPADYPVPRVRLLPTVYRTSNEGEREALVDTTPLIRNLEMSYTQRSVIPENPALAFLCDLIEDYADEWLTKVMFHYRWAHEADRQNIEPLLVYWADPTLDADTARVTAEKFGQRQYERLYVVGSNAVTGPTIEDSFTRLVPILDTLIARRGFVLGGRPSAADFALYGQLTQLVQVEPTPAALVRGVSQRLPAWVDRMEDLSGNAAREEDWDTPELALKALAPLLGEIGRVYLPFLLGNAAAAAAGEDTVNTEVDGRLWTQPVFPYQVKCFKALLDGFKALPAEDKEFLTPVLTETGCQVLVNNGTPSGS